MSNPLDLDAVIAAVDLIGRTGARQFELGWLNDPDDPAYAARGPEWWAKAQYRGKRISVEGFALPDQAAEALSLRLLHGARCRCGRLVRLAGFDGAFAYRDTEMADGTRWTAEEAAAVGQCEWRRDGKRWDPSCPEPGPNRAQRRRRR